MNNLNSILLEGTITCDPLFRTTANGTAICTFGIESHYEKAVYFFEVEALGKLADSCSSHGRKGRLVRIVGRLKQEQWEQNGQQKSRVVIEAEHVEFISAFFNSQQEKEKKT